MRLRSVFRVVPALLLMCSSAAIAATDYNIGAAGTATQSSTNSGRAADRAIDGNTSNSNPYFQMTNRTNQPWWEVDLGAVKNIDEIRAYNRTSNAGRATNFHIFVSETPFVSTTVAGVQAEAGVTDYHFTGQMQRPSTQTVGLRGRYVRIQLEHTNQYLHMSEVQIIGDDLFTITVDATGTGDGQVTPDAGSISCDIDGGVGSGTCSELLSDGNSLSLTATPDANSTFDGWIGCDVPIGNLCIQTLSGADSMPQASFTLIPRSLTVDGIGSGSGSISSDSSLSCSSAAGSETGTCSETLADGDVVVLTANADAGSTFDGWIGCDAPTGTVCTQTISGGDEIVQASFGGFPEIAVTGNGVNIADGDMVPGTADGTDFGSVTLTSGIGSQTFTVSNPGNSDLTITSVSLSGSDIGDFTLLGTTSGVLAGGESLTFQVQFDPSTSGTKTATVSVLSDDVDEGAFDFALSGTGAPESSVTIVQRVTGGDATVTYTSSEDMLNFSISTAGGEGQYMLTELSAGSYTVRMDDLRQEGFSLEAISCDDSNSTGNVDARSMTLNITTGEVLTCTVTHMETREATAQIIKTQMTNTAQMRLSNLPTSQRRIGRLRGGSQSAQSGQFSYEGYALGTPLPFNAQVSRNSVAYSTLSNRLALEANRDRYSGSYNSAKGDDKWSIWSEIRYSKLDGGEELTGTYGVLQGGLDYKINDQFLVGALLQYDAFDQSYDTGVEIGTTGLMTGAYATVRMAERLYFDVLGALGSSTTDISPFGTYEDQYRSRTWMLMASLVGDFDMGRWNVAPSFTYSAAGETQESYLDSQGILIPSQTVSRGQMSVGNRLSYLVSDNGSSSVRMWGGFDSNFAFSEDVDTSVSGSLQCGLSVGNFFNLYAGYGGLGTDVKTQSISVNFRKSF